MRMSSSCGARPILLTTLTFIGAGLLLLPAGPVPAGAQQVTALQAQEVTIPTRAEADLVLSLNEAIDVSLDKSFGIFQLQQGYLQTSYYLEYSQRALKPHMQFNSNGLPGISQSIDPQFYYNPITGQQELGYLKMSRMTGDMALSLWKPLITNGSVAVSMGMSGNEAENDLPAGGNTKNRSFQPFVGVSFNQPMFQYNSRRGDLRDNELRMESQALRYTEEEVRQINQVTRTFYDLLQQQQAVELAAEDYDQSVANYRTGLRRYHSAQQNETDVLSLQVEMSNALSSLEQEKVNLESQQFAFNRGVGLPLETRIWVEEDLQYEPIEVDVERALELALEQRSDIRRAEITLEQDELTLRQQVSNGRPDLQLNASYALSGNSSLSATADDPWSTHFSEALNADNRSPLTRVSLTLSIPILDGKQNRALVERQMSVIREQERQIEEARATLRQEVINRVRAVESAMRQMEIREQSLQIARTSYQITRQQYERGETDLNTLLRAQTTRRNSETQHLQARITYEMAKANLKEITLWDWETNQPVRQRTTTPVPFGG